MGIGTSNKDTQLSQYVSHLGPKNDTKIYFSVHKIFFILRFSSHFSFFYPPFALSALPCRQKWKDEMVEIIDGCAAAEGVRRVWEKVE